MESQNFANHRRFVTGFHFLLSLMLLAGVIVSCVNVYRQTGLNGLLSSVLILFIFICLFLMSWFIRNFPVKAQDRAIRAEESLRYFILTGKAISPQLTVAQIAALRFAPDEEFIPLIDKAVAENLSSNDIKKAIKNWRADYHRV